jgi:crotonobetainyl-CoA:carnitine CoA-transferase CaiB-like acyl-CoA transferase
LAAKELPAPNVDFYEFAETLPAEELAVLKQVRTFMETKVAPIITKYWVEDAFPFEVLPAFKELNIGGLGIQGLVAELDALFETQSLAYWKNVLDAVRLPYGGVQIPEEIVNDPQLHANRIVVPIADGSASLKYTVDSPLTVKDSLKVAPRRAPSHGEHTNEVLLEIGFDKPAVEALLKSGVVSAAHKQEPSPAA